jgi:hypothetical protein
MAGSVANPAKVSDEFKGKTSAQILAMLEGARQAEAQAIAAEDVEELSRISARLKIMEAKAPLAVAEARLVELRAEEVRLVDEHEKTRLALTENGSEWHKLNEDFAKVKRQYEQAKVANSSMGNLLREQYRAINDNLEHVRREVGAADVHAEALRRGVPDEQVMSERETASMQAAQDAEAKAECERQAAEAEAKAERERQEAEAAQGDEHGGAPNVWSMAKGMIRGRDAGGYSNVARTEVGAE